MLYLEAIASLLKCHITDLIAFSSVSEATRILIYEQQSSSIDVIMKSPQVAFSDYSTINRAVLKLFIHENNY